MYNFMFIFHRFWLSLSRGSFMSSRKSPLRSFIARRFRPFDLADLQFFGSILLSKMGWFWADSPASVVIPHAPKSASPPVRLVGL
jgi:hypothetical protein